MESISCVNFNKFDELKESITDYLSEKDSLLTGIEDYDHIVFRKKKILKQLNATDKDFDNYKWQLSNRFDSIKSVSSLLDFKPDEKDILRQISKRYRFAISPYYASLINPADPFDPIRLQSIPSVEELNDEGKLDPMDEKSHAVSEIITRRYPDRLIIKVTNSCGMFCRFCQRRRMIGETDMNVKKSQLKNAFEYIAFNKEIRDVLITGGDSFLLSNDTIEWILRELREIKHVEIIRFGTRTAVTLPQRISPELVSILKKYHPVYVNTHFNHPMEITPESKTACELLADAGIPLGNQMVLLNGVNNHPHIVKKLNQSLLRIRVKPYYIFHPKKVKGTKRFWLTIQEGMDIMESLRGSTSGMAIPTYIINGPGGMGKTPILPNYLLYMGKDKAVFRNWQGKSFEVRNI